MKTLKAFLFLSLTFFSGYSFAQSIEGRVTLSGLSHNTTLKEATAVDLFKSFKDGKYKINFSFKAKDVNKRNIVLFDMKTTIKLNGKTIAKSVREGWAWLPEDMYVPVEAFDLIPGLQKAGSVSLSRIPPDKMDATLPKGKYEITLEMDPSSTAIKGKVKPLTFSFTVK